jgi:hypothetical protein
MEENDMSQEIKIYRKYEGPNCRHKYSYYIVDAAQEIDEERGFLYYMSKSYTSAFTVFKLVQGKYPKGLYNDCFIGEDPTFVCVNFEEVVEWVAEEVEFKEAEKAAKKERKKVAERKIKILKELLDVITETGYIYGLATSKTSPIRYCRVKRTEFSKDYYIDFETSNVFIDKDEYENVIAADTHIREIKLEDYQRDNAYYKMRLEIQNLEWICDNGGKKWK